MTNLDAIRHIKIGGICPFINADRRFMVSVLVELSMCEECPWLPDMYSCEWGHSRGDFCTRKVEEWLDTEEAEA